MNEEQGTPSVKERVSAKLPPVPGLALWLLLPVEGVGVLVFISYAAFHFTAFVSQTTAIVSWCVWFFSLLCYIALAWLAVRTVRAGIEALLALGHGIVEIQGKHIENRAARARRELLYTSDNAIVYLVNGKITYQSVVQERYNHSIRHGYQEQIEAPDGEEQALLGPGALPTMVRYEDVRGQVPQNHILIGVGTAGVETKERARCGACVWIVGLSGTGKTSTTVLRVEERRADGYKFLGADPHWFKDDSLTNAVAAYADDFLLPMARTAEEINAVYKAFLEEFYARRSGKRVQPLQKITLLVDEVGAQMDPANAIEKENAKMLPTIARICGQEARNFHMGGIFVSQQATGLAWLRKVALLVIVHQLLMESEKQLAVNGDTSVVNDMKKWPVGRTYVYGVGFGTDGPLTVQQPYYARQGGAWCFPDDTPAIEGSLENTARPGLRGLDTSAQGRGLDTEHQTGALPMDEDLRDALDAWLDGATGPRAMQRALDCTYYKAQQLCTQLIEKGLTPVESDAD